MSRTERQALGVGGLLKPRGFWRLIILKPPMFW